MLRICALDDVRDMCELVYTLNQIPEKSCAYCEKDQDSIAKSLRQLILQEGHYVVGSFENKELVGVLGLFADPAKNRVDCVGPFVSHSDSLVIAAKLFRYGRSAFKNTNQFHFFFDRRNEDLLQLMRIVKAHNNGNEWIMSLERDRWIPEKTEATPLPPPLFDRWVQLHDSLFPGVYVSGSDILQSLGTDRSVFCLADGENLFGYVVIKESSRSTERTIEILAVDKPYRKKGYGKTLLNHALYHSFEKKEIQKISLVVETGNSPAAYLYSSLGFSVDAELCSFCVPAILEH